MQRLRARVGPFEVQKLDQHLDALRALEKKRQAAIASGRLHPSEPTERLSAPRAPQRRRALLRRDHRSPHRSARARDELRHHALRNPRDERSLVCGESARPARGQPRRHGAHLFGVRPRHAATRRAGNPATWTLLARFNRYVYGKVARLLSSASTRTAFSTAPSSTPRATWGTPPRTARATSPPFSPAASAARSAWAAASVSNRLPARHLV